jgi:hypothetical protein
MEHWLGHMPALQATAEQVADLRMGRRITGLIEGRGRIHDQAGALVAIVEPRNGLLQPLLVI